MAAIAMATMAPALNSRSALRTYSEIVVSTRWKSESFMRATKLRIPQALAGLEGTARLTAEIAGAVLGTTGKLSWFPTATLVSRRIKARIPGWKGAPG